MTPTEISTALTSIMTTLNTIEVKGEENMNHLLGCILLLKKTVIPAVEALASATTPLSVLKEGGAADDSDAHAE